MVGQTEGLSGIIIIKWRVKEKGEITRVKGKFFVKRTELCLYKTKVKNKQEKKN